MPEHDNGDDQLRREFLRQAPQFDLRSTLPRRVAELVRHRQLFRLIFPIAIAAAVVIAVAVPLASLRSSPVQGHTAPVGSTPTTTAGVTTTTGHVASTATTTTTTTTTTTPGTEQITYQPFTGSKVDPTLHVTSQESGSCYQFGGGVDGRYYYRCSTIQPCFSGPQGTSAPLVCPAQGDPTTDDVILWTATSVNTTDFTPATSKVPWAMQLSNGTVCSVVAAAWSGLGPYGCQNESEPTPADCRQPQPSPGFWTAACQDEITAASPFTSTTVVKVWF